MKRILFATLIIYFNNFNAGATQISEPDRNYICGVYEEIIRIPDITKEISGKQEIRLFSGKSSLGRYMKFGDKYLFYSGSDGEANFYVDEEVIANPRMNLQSSYVLFFRKDPKSNNLYQIMYTNQNTKRGFMALCK